eukprot:6735839-Pyramimonas_sp.AAC.1
MAALNGAGGSPFSSDLSSAFVHITGVAGFLSFFDMLRPRSEVGIGGAARLKPYSLRPGRTTTHIRLSSYAFLCISATGPDMHASFVLNV